nr:MAG TPA: protein of unknown function (UPF0242) [Caudoviricetes sp.]
MNRAIWSFYSIGSFFIIIFSIKNNFWGILLV